MKKILFLSLALILFIIFDLFLFLSRQGTTPSSLTVPPNPYLASTLKAADWFFKEKRELSGCRSVIFLGDIMLDRGVEHYIKENNNWFYPFEKIAGFLQSADIVFANLEGPIVKKPPAFPSKSLRFAFATSTAEAMKKTGINLVSLANNHTLNMQRAGLKETQEILMQSGIGFLGDPVYCSFNFKVEKKGIIFLAFNKTFAFNCTDSQIAGLVKQARASSTDSFIAVAIHWGEEYEAKHSKKQEGLAHLLIDAGADLIIGHHPHVVQDVELYNKKAIFYSLGNFVFDQHFSTSTQQGLAAGLLLCPGKAEYRLFPVKIPKSQPRLMERAEAQHFLSGLAGRSSSSLERAIKQGIIKLDR